MPKTRNSGKAASKPAAKSKTRVATKTAALNKSAAKKHTATTSKLVWRDLTCRVRHTPNYISKGWSPIEIIVLTPKGGHLHAGRCAAAPVSDRHDDADL